MQSAVTVSLVEEARGGPFVFWHDLPGACRVAAELGFDAIELFAPAADAVDRKQLWRLLDAHGLKLAAVGTGAGWLRHRLHLTLPDAKDRERAQEFIRSMIDLGGEFGAPAIVGSMQGEAPRKLIARLLNSILRRSTNSGNTRTGTAYLCSWSRSTDMRRTF